MQLFATVAVIISVLGLVLILAVVFLVYKYNAQKRLRRLSRESTPPLRKVKVLNGRITSNTPSARQPSVASGWNAMRSPGWLFSAQSLYKGDFASTRPATAHTQATDTSDLERGLQEEYQALPMIHLPSPSVMNRPKKPPRLLPSTGSRLSGGVPVSGANTRSSKGGITPAPILEAPEQDYEFVPTVPAPVENRSPAITRPPTAILTRFLTNSWYKRRHNIISAYSPGYDFRRDSRYERQSELPTPSVGAETPVEVGTAAMISLERPVVRDSELPSAARQSFLDPPSVETSLCEPEAELPAETPLAVRETTNLDGVVSPVGDNTLSQMQIASLKDHGATGGSADEEKVSPPSEEAPSRSQSVTSSNKHSATDDMALHDVASPSSEQALSRTHSTSSSNEHTIATPLSGRHIDAALHHMERPFELMPPDGYVVSPFGEHHPPTPPVESTPEIEPASEVPRPQRPPLRSSRLVGRVPHQTVVPIRSSEQSSRIPRPK